MKKNNLKNIPIKVAALVLFNYTLVDQQKTLLQGKCFSVKFNI